MKGRTIKTIVYAATFDMGGMPVRQAFPSQKVVAPDPFLLLHHADVKVPATYSCKQGRCRAASAQGFFAGNFYF